MKHLGTWRVALVAILSLVGGSMVQAATTETAIFAGGCFWCMEPEFKAVAGVSKVVSGYTGGHVKNPTYEQVSRGDTGHVEAIEVTYDPAQVSYESLLAIFWRNIDPLDAYGQFCDKGSQYRAGIFTHGEEQKAQALASREKVAAMFKKPVETLVEEASIFYPAEDYHQDFYIKSKARYKMYRMGCGRDAQLDRLWSDKPSVDKAQ
jgi:peptide-methionine (S)-S-oxide reductase